LEAENEDFASCLLYDSSYLNSPLTSTLKTQLFHLT